MENRRGENKNGYVNGWVNNNIKNHHQKITEIIINKNVKTSNAT
jgi:hypothetical protein